MLNTMTLIAATASALRSHLFQWLHSPWPARAFWRSCAMALALALMAPGSWANVGSILNILGTAKIQKRTGQVAPAIRGDILYEGDTVWAEGGSNVQIRMVDGAMVWVRANSELKIEGYKSSSHGGAKNESSLRLLSGSMRTVTGLIGKQNPENYRLSTPNATIGVRGTEFDAVYVSGTTAGQFKAESGTYHRVHQGSTQLRAGAQDIGVAEGQAVFVGASSGNAPRRLTTIPEFLNLPANATTSTGGVASAPAPARERLAITVRYGNPNNRTGEATVLLDNGSPASVPGQQLLGLTSLQIGAERVDSNRLAFAMTAARPGGRGTTVQWQLGDVQIAGRPGGNSQLRLTMDLPSGIWMEVTDRGPWQAVNKALAASATRFEVPKVFVMADEAK